MPKYTWKAIYKDNSFLDEYEKGTQNKFDQIDQKRLVIFQISDNQGNNFNVNIKTGEFNLNGLKMMSYTLPNVRNGEESAVPFRLIYFKRIRKTFSPNGLEEKRQYCIGIQCKYENKNHQQLVWIQEDGSIIINGLK